MNNDEISDQKRDTINAFFLIASRLMNFADSQTGRKENGIMRTLLHRQKMALFFIDYKTQTEPKGISLSVIADELSIPVPSASLLVESLVKKELCLRVMNPVNRRSVNITLTPFGRRIVRNINNRVEQKFQELQEGLTDQEIEIFEKVILHCQRQMISDTRKA